MLPTTESRGLRQLYRHRLSVQGQYPLHITSYHYENHGKPHGGYDDEQAPMGIHHVPDLESNHSMNGLCPYTPSRHCLYPGRPMWSRHSSPLAQPTFITDEGPVPGDCTAYDYGCLSNNFTWKPVFLDVLTTGNGVRLVV